jgi:hypothetical protein
MGTTTMSRDGLRIDRPIVLLASERSGGNLLRAMLGSHSQIVAPSPVHFLISIDPLLPLYGDLSEDASFREACEDVSRFFQHQIAGQVEPPEAAALFETAGERSLVGLMDAAFHLIMRASGAARVLLKENEAFRYAHRLANNYPDIRFLYLVRDGRDAALSWLKSPNHFGGITHIARIWRDEQRACLSLLCDPGLSGRIQVVHYEDLVSKPREIIEALCDFLQVDFEESMLEFHGRDEIREQSAGVRNWENLSKPIMERNFNKHQKELGWWRAQTFNQIAHRELAALGYDVPKLSAVHRVGSQVLDLSKEGLGLALKAARGRVPKPVEVLARGKRRRNFGRIASELEARQRPRWPRQQ